MKKSILIAMLILSMTSCTKSSTGNNKNAISVTGDVTCSGTEATIYAWANIPSEYKSIVNFGIYLRPAKETVAGYKTANYLDSDNKYSVTFTSLTHTTKYCYRSFVKYVATDNYEYGEWKEFTTTASKPTFGKYRVVDTCYKYPDIRFSVDDGGSDITSYEAYYALGTSGGSWTKVENVYYYGELEINLPEIPYGAEVNQWVRVKAEICNSMGCTQSSVISFKTTSK